MTDIPDTVPTYYSPDWARSGDPDDQADTPPDCHADGLTPQGYDPPDPACWNCPDKVTCFVSATEHKLRDYPEGVATDKEIEVLLRDQQPFEFVLDRMRARVELDQRGEAIPPTLLPTFPDIVDEFADDEPDDEPEEDVADDEPEGEPDVEEPEEPEPDTAPEEEPEPEPAPKPKKRKKKQPPKGKQVVRADDGTVSVDGIDVGSVRDDDGFWGWWSLDEQDESEEWYENEGEAVAALLKTSAVEQILAKAKKPKTKPKKKPRKKATPKPKAKSPKPKRKSNDDKPDSWPTMSTGKPLPSPTKLPQAAMDELLEETQRKLGANVQLEYGMKLCRRKRTGDCLCVITHEGFAYEVDKELAKAAGFKTTKQVFGSLSSVAMWHELRSVSGNDFFNIAKHSCTEIRDDQNRVIDRKGGL